MTYAEFKWKVKKAYPGIDISFSSNGVKHTAVIDDSLTLYTNAESEAVYGVINDIPIGRSVGIE